MNQLQTAEGLNKEIKRILCETENMSLRAAMTIQIVQQEEHYALGLGLTARELQRFNKKIAAAMRKLSGLIAWQAEVKAGKHLHYHNRAFPYPADADEIEQLIVNEMCVLQLSLMHAAKQCSTGFAVMRSVDMEIGPGNETNPGFTRFIQEVEEAIAQIALHIGKLELHLIEAGLWKRRRLCINP